MNWIQHGMGHYAAPYRVYHSIRGYEAWIFGKTQACLGRQLSLPEAKRLCEQHRAKAKETA